MNFWTFVQNLVDGDVCKNQAWTKGNSGGKGLFGLAGRGGAWSSSRGAASSRSSKHAAAAHAPPATTTPVASPTSPSQPYPFPTRHAPPPPSSGQHAVGQVTICHIFCDFQFCNSKVSGALMARSCTFVFIRINEE